MPTNPTLVYEVDPRAALKALEKLNAGFANSEGKFVGTTKGMEQASKTITDTILKLVDRQYQANERLVKSIEAKAVAEGKSNTQKLIEERNRKIKQLGDEEEQIKRVTAAYQKLIDAEDKKTRGGGFTKATDFIQHTVQNPASGLSSAASGALGSVGPIGAGIAAGAATLSAIAVAGYQAAKGLGEYGTRVSEASVQTGIGVKRIQELDFAAKAVGKDLSVVDRTVSTLTDTLQQQNIQGDKARAWMTSFGVSANAMRDGIIPADEVLARLSHGLNSLGSDFERNKAAADLFGKSRGEVIPFLKDLESNLRTASGIKFATDEDIARFKRYQTEVQAIETQWDQLALKLKEPIAATVLASIKWIGSFGDVANQLDKARAVEASQAGGLGNATISRDQLNPKAPGVPVNELNREYAAGTRAMAGIKGSLSRSPEGLKYLLSEAERKAQAAGDEYVNMQNSSFASAGSVSAAKKAWDDAERVKKAYQDQMTILSSLKGYIQSLRVEQANANASELSELDKINAKNLERVRINKEQHGSSKQAADIIEKINKAELDAYNRKAGREIGGSQFLSERNQAANKIRTDAELFGARRKAAGAELGNEDIEEQYKAQLALADNAYKVELRHIEDLRDTNTDAYQIRKALIEADDRLTTAKLDAETQRTVQLIDLEKKRHEAADRSARVQLENIQKLADAQSAADQANEDASVKHRIRMRDIALPSNATTRQQIGNVRAEQGDLDSLAQSQYRRTSDRLDKEILDARAQQEKALATEKLAWEQKIGDLQAKKIDNEAKLWQQINQDRMTAEERIGDIQKRRRDEIQATTKDLLHTLFTDSSKFGDKFKTTIRDAALKPLENGLASMASRPIERLFGVGKTGKMSDLKVGTKEDALKVYVVNTAGQQVGVPGVFGDVLGGGTSSSGGGFGGFSLPGLGGGSGSAVTPPFVSGGGAKLPTFSMDTNGFGGLMGGAPGGTSGFTGPVGGGSGSPGGLGLGTIFGKGHGLSGIKGNLGEWVKSQGGLGSFSHGKNGGINGVDGIAGNALMAGGTMLAMNGLLGDSRGTTAGMFKGAAGGAMIGMKFGGPLGAAIGAGVGFGIGLGEKLAGVESPFNKVKRIAKQRFGITLTDPMAKQLVALAKQSYYGNVDLMMTSPEVRDKLELWASGTGQSLKGGSNTVRAGYLVNEGGQLKQQASYKYGQAYTFASNLPIAGGGSQMGSNQPMSLHVNVNGQGAGQFLQGQIDPQYVQAQWNNAQQASNGRVSNSALMAIPNLIT